MFARALLDELRRQLVQGPYDDKRRREMSYMP